jgi:sugar (pentulose or hexulose) kinase
LFVVSVIGLDIGTSSCKGLLLSSGASVVEVARRGYGEPDPGVGVLVLDPLLVRTAMLDLVAELGAVARSGGDPVTAVSFSVSGDEGVPVDGQGTALYPCILSADQRGGPQASQLEADYDNWSQQTGLPVASNYPVVRLMWLRDNEPAVFARTRQFWCWEELCESWLGAPPVIDPTLAARVGAFDLTTHGWSPAILDACDLDVNVLPQIAPSGTTLGTVARPVADELGLDHNVAVVAGGFDQVMAAFGSGAHAPGQGVLSLGTWEALTVATAHEICGPAIQGAGMASGPYVTPAAAHVLAVTPNGGAARSRLVRLLGGDGADVSGLLASADERHGLVVVPDISGCYTPWMERDSTASISGLTLTTTPGHILAAFVEATSFDLRYALEALAAADVEVSQLRVTSGGANSEALLQLKANSLGVALTQAPQTESGCLAAAALAGSAQGLWNATEALEDEAGRLFEPEERHRARYSEQYENYVSLRKERLVART